MEISKAESAMHKTAVSMTPLCFVLWCTKSATQSQQFHSGIGNYIQQGFTQNLRPMELKEPCFFY
jgi:hypothetical protein